MLPKVFSIKFSFFINRNAAKMNLNTNKKHSRRIWKTYTVGRGVADVDVRMRGNENVHWPHERRSCSRRATRQRSPWEICTWRSGRGSTREWQRETARERGCGARVQSSVSRRAEPGLSVRERARANVAKRAWATCCQTRKLILLLCTLIKARETVC